MARKSSAASNLIKSPYIQAGKGRPSTPKPIPYPDEWRTGVRTDGWENWNTGLGVTGWDKTRGTLYLRDCRIDDDQLAGLYYGNDIAKIIVNSQVDEAFRVGYELNLPDDADNSDKDELDTWKPAIDTAVRDLLRWAALYGGAAIYLDVEDGSSVLDPLDVKKVKKINSLRVFDRRYVWPLGYDTDPTSPTYWLPEYYGFGGSMTGALDSPRVHHSRLLRAVGLEADRRESQYLFWWGHSVLQPIYQTLLRLGLAEQSTVVMMQDATQFIYYIKGLIDAIASKDAAGIQARYHQIDSARGTNRALLLDAGQTGTDAEKVEKLTTPFTGVYDILTFMQSRVASAAEMPVSVLFGTGFHGGLSDKGEGDLRLWHAKVQGYQTREVEPALRRLYALVGEVLGVDTSDLKFAWKPLYEPTAAEFAAMYFQMAQGDNIYMTAGALRPEEVTISRFGSGKFSTETTVDVELYRASLKMAPSPTQAPPTPIAGGAPNAGPPIPPAGVSTEKPGVLGTPPGQIPAKPMPGAPAAAQAPAEKPDMNPGAKPPLAAGEVGGSNKAETEPQISDLTGRGNPNGDKTPNQLPPDASGVDPNQTPVQGQAPESEKATPEPSKGNGPKSKPDELSIEHGETKVKIKIQKPEKAK